MVRDRLTDGTRIAQLLASELTGHGGRLETVSVVDANPDVEATVDGALAYVVAVGSEDDESENTDRTRLAEVYVQPDRTRVEFRRGQEAAARAAEAAGLRVRPKATHPPRTLVFVEDGAAVKRALPVVEAAAASAFEPVEE